MRKPRMNPDAVPLHQQLERYAVRHAQGENTLIETFLDLLENAKGKSPSCFDRERLPGHFTASGLVIRQTNIGLETLLTHHAKLNIWIQPGGHADGDPDLLGVAAREVMEETGLTCIPLIEGEILDIDLHRIPQNSSMPEHLHYDVRYLFLCEPEGEFVMSEESIDMEWRSLQEIIDTPQYDPSLRKLTQKALILQG